MSEVNCPNCQHGFNVEPRVIIPDEQRVSLEITTENEYFSAKSMGGVITSFDKLMQSVAKDAGGKVQTMVAGVHHDGKTIRLDFVVIDCKLSGESK